MLEHVLPISMLYPALPKILLLNLCRNWQVTVRWRILKAGHHVITLPKAVEHHATASIVPFLRETGYKMPA